MDSLIFSYRKICEMSAAGGKFRALKYVKKLRQTISGEAFYDIHYSAEGFSTCAMADFCMGIRQFLLFPNSTITVSSVISITTP